MFNKLNTYMIIFMMMSLFSCRSNKSIISSKTAEPSDSSDVSTDKCFLMGTLEAYYESPTGITLKGALDGAMITIDGRSIKSDNYGNFTFSNLTCGKKDLIISHIYTGRIDTSLVIPSENIRLVFYVSPLLGGVNRFLRSWETRRTNVPIFYQNRAPISSTVLIDDLFTIQTESDRDCNFRFNVNSICLAYGKHNLKVIALDQFPLDTIITVNHQFTCLDPNANNPSYVSPLNLTVKPIPYSRFDYPNKIGTSWIYKYYYRYTHFSEAIGINGLHFWAILDSSYEDRITHFNCRSISQDTILYLDDNNNWVPDHSVTDTAYFNIDFYSEIIIVRSPKTFWGSKGDTLKGFFNGSQYKEFRSGNSTEVIYKEGIGLISYHAENNTNTHIKENLDLIEMKQ